MYTIHPANIGYFMWVTDGSNGAIQTEIKDAVKKMNKMVENEEALRELVYANTIVV